MIDIRTAGAKGLGVFAKKLIPRGTRIFSERPLLTIQSDNVGSLYPAVKLLSTQDRDALMALSSFRTRELDLMRWSVALIHTAKTTISTVLSAFQGKTAFAPANKRNSISDHVEVVSIFRSNSFSIGAKLGIALFPKIARINHSCLPNAQGNFHEGLGRFNVHATRDIEADEEVSLNYLLESGQLRDVRVEKLSRGYGFECACPACDMSGKRGKDGEEKRIAMGELLKAFVERPMVGDVSDKEAELETIMAYIELYEGEGIAGKELSSMYMEAVNINTALHKPKEALKCAALAKELDKDCFGEDHTDAMRGNQDGMSFLTLKSSMTRALGSVPCSDPEKLNITLAKVLNSAKCTKRGELCSFSGIPAAAPSIPPFEFERNRSIITVQEAPKAPDYESIFCRKGPVSANLSAAYVLQDDSQDILRLIYNYGASTSKSISDSPDCVPIWRDVVPALAFKHDFLLSGVFSVSALYLGLL
ncbi:hypothetical protein DL95DRAFT_517736 [Leptodontidium sp. 2 PMI_412]|nr:hypothetical protein DL95DRAFT_517736 [Leptodontidium sp. 2 PMI_412]